MSPNNSYQIVTVRALEELEHYLANGLWEVYQQAFGDYPWYEIWTEEDVDLIMKEYFLFRDSKVDVAMDKDKAVGLGARHPLEFDAEVAEHLRKVLDVPTTMYMADVAVFPANQKQGWGTRLVNSSFVCLPAWCTGMVMRTAKEGSKSEQIFARCNFKHVDVPDMQVESLRLDGIRKSDPRVFMYCRADDICFAS